MRGVVGVAGLVEVPLLEGVGVDDDRAAGLESTEFAAQRRRVHGHEHRGGVAGRGDDLAGDLHLEGRDAMHGARRRPDLSGEVRQGGEVVTEHGTGGGEAITGELHAVAGVAGKANDEPLEILNGARRGWFRSNIGHVRSLGSLLVIGAVPQPTLDRYSNLLGPGRTVPVPAPARPPWGLPGASLAGSVTTFTQ